MSAGQRAAREGDQAEFDRQPAAAGDDQIWLAADGHLPPATMRFLLGGAIPVGTVLGAAASTRAALSVGTVGLVLSCLPLLRLGVPADRLPA